MISIPRKSQLIARDICLATWRRHRALARYPLHNTLSLTTGCALQLAFVAAGNRLYISLSAAKAVDRSQYHVLAGLAVRGISPKL